MKQPSKSEVEAGRCGPVSSNEKKLEQLRADGASTDTMDRLVRAEDNLRRATERRESSAAELNDAWTRADELREKAEAEAFGACFHRLLLQQMQRGDFHAQSVVACAASAAGIPTPTLCTCPEHSEPHIHVSFSEKSEPAPPTQEKGHTFCTGLCRELAARQDERAKVADRLGRILYPNSTADVPDLETQLREVDKRLNRTPPPLGNPPPYIVLADVEKELAAALNTEPDDLKDLLRFAQQMALDAKKWRDRDETATSIRDAALEEVGDALANAGWGMNSEPQGIVRALKSKSAPCGKHMGTMNGVPFACTLPPNHQVKPHTHQMDDGSAFTEKQPAPHAHINGCSLDTDHKGACFGPSPMAPAPQPSGNPGELPQRGPVHDFGWALAQMRAGRAVRRATWMDHEFVVMGKARRHGHALHAEDGESVGLSKDVFATDWEVAE